jgi:hypothetical protein
MPPRIVQMSDEQHAERRAIRTLCVDCEGRGERLAPRMWQGRLHPEPGQPIYTGTRVVPTHCKACGGTGWINGF